MIRIPFSYNKYKIPTDKFFINNYLVPRLRESNVLSFTFNLMGGFKTEKGLEKDAEKTQENEEEVNAKFIFLMIIAMLPLCLFIFLLIKIRIIRYITLFYIAFQIIVYVGSVAIGFLQFFVFALILRRNYNLDVSIFGFEFKGKNALKNNKYVRKINSRSYKGKKEKKLAFYFDLYENGGITKQEYEKEKKNILNQEY